LARPVESNAAVTTATRLQFDCVEWELQESRNGRTSRSGRIAFASLHNLTE